MSGYEMVPLGSVVMFVRMLLGRRPLTDLEVEKVGEAWDYLLSTATFPVKP